MGKEWGRAMWVTVKLPSWILKITISLFPVFEKDWSSSQKVVCCLSAWPQDFRIFSNSNFIHIYTVPFSSFQFISCLLLFSVHPFLPSLLPQCRGAWSDCALLLTCSVMKHLVDPSVQGTLSYIHGYILFYLENIISAHNVGCGGKRSPCEVYGVT